MDSIINKMGFSEEQIAAFKKLLKMTSNGENLKSSLETPLGALDYLVKITQENWIRKPGTERWEQEDSAWMIAKRKFFLKLFNQLGMLTEKKPKFLNYNYILLLGSVQERVKKRLDYLTLLLEKGIRFKQLVLLSGQRPLLKDKESIAKMLKQDATELDMMQVLLMESQLRWPIKLSEINVLIINSPALAGERPTTSDTINEWLITDPLPGSILVISNQPYISYQNVVIANALPLGFILDTVGCAVYSKEKISVMLDLLARRIFADYFRIKTELTHMMNSETLKQEYVFSNTKQ